MQNLCDELNRISSDEVGDVDILLEHKNGFFFHIHNHNGHYFFHGQSSSLEEIQEHVHSVPGDDAEEDDALDVDH